MTQVKPEARINMISINDAKDESSEHREVPLPLLAEILEHELQNELLRLREAMYMEDTEHLEPVVVNVLVCVETWDRRDAVNEEVAAVGEGTGLGKGFPLAGSI